METFWFLITSFILGAIGALLIVWLRWIGTLPRFSSSIEIELIEDEYKHLSAFIATKIKKGKGITDSEVQHSDNLRDDVWRQRTISFMVSAFLYVILGGATAVLFVGLKGENILDSLIVGKLLTAGALWSSFYSFIDVKQTAEAIETIKEKKQAEALEEFRKTSEEKLKETIEKANNSIVELTNKYNELVEKYEKLKKKAMP